MGLAAAIFLVVSTIVTVIKVLRWQKNKTLDIPIAIAEQTKE